MADNMEVLGRDSSIVAQNKVLSSTYRLLGLTMVPTVVGALVGVNTSFAWLMAMSPLMQMGLIFAVFYGMIWLVHKNANNAAGVWLLFAFTFMMGYLLGPILQFALNLSNGGQLIGLAAGGTGAIFFTLSAIASNAKRDFGFLGKFVAIGIILLLLAIVANVFFQIPALALTISAVMILVMSALILYQINQVVRGGETNYVLATMSVYISLYNIFTSLLHLLMAFAGGND